MSLDPAPAWSGRRGLPVSRQQLVQVRRRRRRDPPEHILQPPRRIQPGPPRRDQQAVDHRAPRSRPGMPQGTTHASSHAGLRIRNKMPGPAASPGNREWNAPSPTADGHGPCQTRTPCRTTNACALDKARSTGDEFAYPRALEADTRDQVRGTSPQDSRVPRSLEGARALSADTGDSCERTRVLLRRIPFNEWSARKNREQTKASSACT